LIAGVVEVGELVEDQHVRAPVVPRQTPMGVHPTQQRGVGHEPPGLVVHDPSLPAGRSIDADSIHAEAHVIGTEVSIAFSATRDRPSEIIGRGGGWSVFR